MELELLNNHSLGEYLKQFVNHNHFRFGNTSENERTGYQRSIVDIRNVHLHTADSYPNNSNEVSGVISEMHALICRVTSL